MLAEDEIKQFKVLLSKISDHEEQVAKITEKFKEGIDDFWSGLNFWIFYHFKY